ncbi:hypothetical protein DM02DRAFT_617120 [Periconia macrospinosa]|uniref:Rhodopsin domain-containing protein n=1 Tax=Periconia macrospinosa TaxID=97972 RepID=A0A2V1DEN6_9PLEO|nr:hypothetical protein DM02DRAFT_617120 [Periconia macrospinosa]
MSSSGIPPLPPPPTDGDVNHGMELNVIIWIFTAITTLIYASRLYSRRFLTRNLGWDDAVLGLSMILLYIQCAMVSISVHYGLARHQYYLLITNPVNISNVIKWQLFSEPVAILGGTVPKIAVTMLITKLIMPDKMVVAYLWSLNIILNAFSIVCIVTSFVQCTPASTYWTRVGGTCWDPHIVANLAITQGALSAFTDFSLAIYPITVLWNLQMAFQKKILVCCLMGFGSIAGIAAIVRTTKLSKLGTGTDLTWELWTLVLWVAIECCIIITCACIPSLRPLGKKITGSPFGSSFPTIFSRGRSANKSGKSYGSESMTLGSLKSQKEGRFVKISAADGDSQVSLARGIRATTSVATESQPRR